MSRCRRWSQSLDSWWRQQVGRWFILFSWSVSGGIWGVKMNEWLWFVTSGKNLCRAFKCKQKSICHYVLLLSWPSAPVQKGDPWFVAWMEWTSSSSASSPSHPRHVWIPKGEAGWDWYVLHLGLKWIQLVCLLKLQENCRPLIFACIHYYNASS